MGASVIIVAISSMTAIIVAALTYYTAKQREREAEWRKEKFAHYKDYFAALAETIGPHVSDDARARYCIAFNTVGLFASQDVIKFFMLIRTSRACLTRRLRLANMTSA